MLQQIKDQTDALTGIDGGVGFVEQDFQTALQGEILDFNHDGKGRAEKWERRYFIAKTALCRRSLMPQRFNVNP